jgi:hypothetical protein
MTQEPDKLINLSVHESSDPKDISPRPDLEADVIDPSDVNSEVHDPKESNVNEAKNLEGSQINIANRSAG